MPSTERTIARSSRDEQHEIARPRAQPVANPELLRLREELDDRRLERAAVAHAHPHQALGAQRFRPVGERVEP